MNTSLGMTNMRGYSSLQARYVGQMAHNLIQDPSDGFVMGLSSRGIYIQIDGNWIIYLSFEKFRGPLTINLPKVAERSQINLREVLTPKMKVELSPGLIRFPRIGYQVSIQNAPVWQTPPRPGSVDESKRGRNLKGFIAGIPNWNEIHQTWHKPIDEVDQLLGKGEGLTPFGDDILIGLLLAINRWGDVLRPDMNVASFNRQICKLARKQTTTLSASLIKCAARGQADKRLIRTIDHLMGDNPHPDQVREDLLQWGHSSGLGALIGMTMAIAHPYSELISPFETKIRM